MKRLSLIFAAMFLVSAMVQAAVTASGSCGADGDNLTWQLTDDGTLTISGTGNMADYNSHRVHPSSPWYSKRSNIRNVVISDGVTSIGDNAFRDCDYLTDLTIGEGVTTIGQYAFFGCSALTDLTIVEGVTTIGEYAFASTGALVVKWNAVNVAIVGSSRYPKIFVNSKVQSVTFSDKVESIPPYLFNGATILSDIEIPANVKSVGAYAFGYAVNDLNVYLAADSVATYCFANCKIKAFTIGTGCRDLGNGVFGSSTTIDTVMIEEPMTLEKLKGLYSYYPKKIELSSWCDLTGYTADFGDGYGLKKLVIDQEFVESGQNFWGYSFIDTLVVEAGIDKLDIANILWSGFDIQVGKVTGVLPDTLVLNTANAGYYEFFPEEDYVHWMNRRKWLYDVNKDGLYEMIYNGEDDKDGLYDCFTLWRDSASGAFLTDRNFRQLDNDTVPEYSYTDGYDNLTLSRLQDGKFVPYYTAKYNTSYNSFCDISGDGLADIVNYGSWSDHHPVIYYAQRSGGYLSTVMNFVDTATVDSIAYAASVDHINLTSTPFIPLTDIFNAMLNNYDYGSQDREYVYAIDLDRNGYTDLLNLYDGTAYLNYGNNNFYYGSIGGTILAVKDINGDYVPEYLVYDGSSTYLISYTSGGSAERKILISDLPASNGWCYDFDKDGDADILLAYDYMENPGYSFVVLFRNDGDGEFKMFENALTEKLDFFDCIDVDNDGAYELYAEREAEDGSKHVTEITISTGFDVAVAGDVIDLDSQGYLAVIGDMDNDGYMELGTDDRLIKLPGSPNSAPEKMQKPAIIYDNSRQKANISWQAGKDKESSSVDLTYALRIGTASGEGDIVFPNADADGRRLDMRDGNMGYNLNAWIDVSGWHPGTYYIAVQAIDPNHKGGPWSDELVYEHSVLGSGFMVDNIEFTTADTLSISFDRAMLQNYTYEWDFGQDAVIVSDTNDLIKIVYDTAGDKEISLRTMDAQGQSTEKTVLVKVSAVRTNADNDRYEQYGGTALVYADWDADGNIDLLSSNGFYQNDGQGSVNGVGKIFNLNLTFDSYYGTVNVVDYNMDGLPDVIGPTNKGNVLINVGDFNFSFLDIENPEYFRSSRVTNLVDLNNDGLVDVLYDFYSSIVISKNPGNLIFSSEDEIILGDREGTPLGYSDVLGIIDVDRDGYTDILIQFTDTYTILYKNKGGFNFERIELPCQNVDDEYTWVADMDQDGYADIVTLSGMGIVTIYYGDEACAFVRTKSILLPVACDNLSMVCDLDNNGYMDIVLSNVLVYFYPDGSHTCQTVGLTLEYNDDNIFAFADINADGVPDLLQRKGITVGDETVHLLRTRHTNTAPETPRNLRVRQTADGVVMQWDDAIDKETPAVQMRYNVSVKIKDAEGENAYLVSPMNCGSDLAAAIPGYSYVSATTYTMPLSRFEAGVEYELRVQSIDLWNAVSATSEPFVFTVDDAANILFDKEEVCVGEPVNATYQAAGFDGSGIEWTAEDGQTSLLENGAASMTWETSGVKTVSATVGGKTVSSSFYVREITDDLSIQLPARVLGGTPVDVVLPEIFTEFGADVQISCEEGEIELTRSELSSKAQIRFPEDGGTYTLTVTYNDGACTTTEYQSVEVVPGGIVPAISVIGVDEESGKLKIQWQLPEGIAAMTDIFDGIVVYKESGRTNNFVKLAELPLESDGYVDTSSNPSVSTTRYRIALSTIYGGESLPSKVHGSVHTMLNQGLSGAVNIIWTPYEGSDVLSYTILRGTSASDMAEIAVLPANSMSYTDMEAGGSAYVYAVSYEVPVSDDWSTALRSYGTASARSNVASSAEAPRTVFAASLGIMSVENEKKLSAAQPTLHLFAEIMPVNATIQQVEWSIESGADLASISIGGELSLKSNEGGTVVVTAKAIDGSGLSATIEVPVTVSCTVSLDVNNPVLGSVSGGGVYESGSVITVSAIPADGCSFVNWSDGNTSAVREITVNGDLDLMANFSRNTAIDESVSTEWTAYSRGMSLVIAGSEDEACVFNLSGVLVYKGIMRTIPVPAEGMYIVRIGDRAEKVMVY